MVARLGTPGDCKDSPWNKSRADAATPGAAEEAHSSLNGAARAGGGGTPVVAVHASPSALMEPAAGVFAAGSAEEAGGSMAGATVVASEAGGEAAAEGGDGLEQFEVERFGSLQEAFDALMVHCRSQHSAHRAEAALWEAERQDLKDNEEMLSQALQTMREALDAETRAHDLDLRTIHAYSMRSRTIEASLAQMAQQPHPAPGSSGPSGSWSMHGRVSEGGGFGGAQRSPSPIVDGDARWPQDGSNGYGAPAGVVDGASAMRPRMLSAGTQGVQRYCPETDSYHLIPQASSTSSFASQKRRNSLTWDGASVRNASSPPKAPGSGTSDQGTLALQRSNAKLVKQIDDLRHSNNEAWTARTHDAHPQNLQPQTLLPEAQLAHQAIGHAGGGGAGGEGGGVPSVGGGSPAGGGGSTTYTPPPMKISYSWRGMAGDVV